ncbi:MAG: magnesium transporter CorA family protein [Cytophagales bacterium]|nr:magnesium transporter CorA family protein [Cytophagales bacterium]
MLEITFPHFTWLSLPRSELATHLEAIQNRMQTLSSVALVDLHVSDLLNDALPSHFDYTADYDLLVFRRLTVSGARAATDLINMDTSPVAFVVMDKVVLSVHPEDCTVRDAFAQRLKGTPADRQPASPADLMLRMVNQMVDAYLDLRRDLTKTLQHWQALLLSPTKRFTDWDALLAARMRLHQLDDTCEDQRAAVQEWIDELDTWTNANTNATTLRENDLLKVRSRDVLEHIERVAHHVRRLEQTLETAIQIHFSIQGNRTNDIMRTLTALTAIFLPLNLVTGFFGMNFEFLPLIHRGDGLWWAVGSMATVTVVLVTVFLRKRYLSRTDK